MRDVDGGVEDGDMIIQISGSGVGSNHRPQSYQMSHLLSV